MQHTTGHGGPPARFITALALGALFVTACGNSGSAAGEGENIRFTLAAGHPAGGAITYTNYAQSFLVPEIERRVEAETDHTVEIDEQYNGTIAPLSEVLEATQSGIADMGLVAYPFEPSNLFLLNASYYVPFGSPDVQDVMTSGRAAFEANPEVSDSLETNFNQRALGFAGVGDYGLITTFPVSGIDSMQGKRISAAGPNLPWISAVGGTPVQGSLNEWYTGFQTGVYDGGITFQDAYAGFKLFEVAPNYTRTGFGAGWVGGIHVNLDFFLDLPEDVQAIIEEVSREYEDTFGEAVAADQEKATATLEAAGVETVELPEDAREEWAEALPNIPAEKAEEADELGLPGSKFMQDYIDAMTEAGYEFPREYELG